MIGKQAIRRISEMNPLIRLEHWGYVGTSHAQCANRFMSPINRPSTTTDSKILFELEIKVPQINL
jgi:hypothetical protein